MKKFSSLCFAVALFLSSPALAALWDVDRDESTIGFTGTQGGEKFDGRFRYFTIDIDFDPQAPETGKIRAAIDMASAMTGNEDRDSTVKTEPWFAISKFPQAIFESTAIHKTAENQYIADGTLTMKGIKKNISLPFTLEESGKTARARGGVELIRTDYGVGTGSWSSGDMVGLNVTVGIDIVATRH